MTWKTNDYVRVACYAQVQQEYIMNYESSG